MCDCVAIGFFQRVHMRFPIVAGLGGMTAYQPHLGLTFGGGQDAKYFSRYPLCIPTGDNRPSLADHAAGFSHIGGDDRQTHRQVLGYFERRLGPCHIVFFKRRQGHLGQGEIAGNRVPWDIIRKMNPAAQP
mgnify:CR=1 FL=1